MVGADDGTICERVWPAADPDMQVLRTDFTSQSAQMKPCNRNFEPRHHVRDRVHRLFTASQYLRVRATSACLARPDRLHAPLPVSPGVRYVWTILVGFHRHVELSLSRIGNVLLDILLANDGVVLRVDVEALAIWL